MQNFYLIDYIKNQLNFDPDLLESLKYELDLHIYSYGQHFRNPNEKYLITRQRLKWLKHLASLIFKSVRTVSNKGGNLDPSLKNVVSNAYFTYNTELKKISYNVFSPPWVAANDMQLTNPDIAKDIQYIYKVFSDHSFNEIISQSFLEKIKKFKEDLKKEFLTSNQQALIVPNDVGFFENTSIKVFHEIEKPTFIFLHGLPGRYNSIDDNRTKFLIVWGEKIKEHYVQAGFNPNKIFISGHPYYTQLPRTNIRFSFEDVLILTKSQNGTQWNDGARLGDRGNSILYLYSIQKVLQKFGIKCVRFRPHPSENGQWYFKFIDSNFFKLDEEKLENSLTRSTLVIGPSSTVLLEAVYYGVNYLIYEPAVEKIDLINFPLVPPFDGSDKRIPTANSEEELESILSEKLGADPSFFSEYIKTPFDLEFIKDLI